MIIILILNYHKLQEIENNMNNCNEFKEALCELINMYSLENDSDTPDYILADYLCSCLEAFNAAHKVRQNRHNYIISE